MNRKNVFVGLVALVLFGLAACTKKLSLLEQALYVAGDNRPELERVLAHYARRPEDSLKLRAARFLIENMPGHYTLEGNLIGHYRREIWRDTALSYFDKKALDISLGHVDVLRESSRRVEDVTRVTAAFLIHHIDRSFERRERDGWVWVIPFDDFLEYVLPYRFEQERLDYWIDSLDVKPAALKELNASDDMRYSVWNRQETFPLTHFESSVPSLPLVRSLNNQLYGDCKHQELKNNLWSRASGFPAVVDFIPYYATRNGYHYWNKVVSPILKDATLKGTLIRESAKVYRKTYSRRREMTIGAGEFVPEFFRNPFCEDVTDEYLHTEDIAVPVLKALPESRRNVYLAVFSNRKWEAVALGDRTSEEGEFRKMGKNIVYLPVSYPEREAVPFNYPFVLDMSGRIKFLVPDTASLMRLRLTRKYPMKNELVRYVDHLKKIVVEAAADASFAMADTVADGLETTRTYACAEFDAEKACRYWRVSLAYNTVCAEIVCLDAEGSVVRGEVDASSAAAFDGNPLTNTEMYRNQVCVIDFGKPVRLAKMIVLPRSDGNGVYPGDEYELFYHALDGWRSLGRKLATDYHLDYDNVPRGALYWLRNRTKGVEERIFTVAPQGGIHFW